jgi:vacuolar-type H+-ATPase subunit E/Vma4
MALEDIIKKIEEEAKISSASILDENKKEEEKILASAEEKAKQRAQEIISNKQQDAQKEKTHILSQANMSARINILQKKQQIIDQVLGKTKEHFAKLDGDVYKKLIINMLLSCASGDEEVCVWEKDKRITPTLINEVNAQLKKQNKPGNLKLTKIKEPIESGFILKGKRILVDNSFPVVIEQVRPALLQELSRILFE